MVRDQENIAGTDWN